MFVDEHSITRHEHPADDERHWKNGETCCHDCRRVWRGNRQGHCANCCEHFGSIGAFDAHQALDRASGPHCLGDWRGRLRGNKNKEQLVEVRDDFGPYWDWKPAEIVH